MFFELRKRSAANIERALQIDVDNRAETIGRQLFSFTEKVTGRAIDDDVDLSELLDRRRDSRFHRLRLTHIRHNRDRFSAVLVDRVSSRLQMVQVAADERHGRARFREGARNAASDACPATGQDRKSTRLNSSHGYISYAVFCLKKKNQNVQP